MNPRLNWEAARCDDSGCDTVVVQQIHNGLRLLSDGQACPGCDGPMHVIRNAALVMSAVLAANGGEA